MIATSPLVPPLDEFGLPAPVWVFQLLLPATFFLHVVFMNITVGTAVLALPLHLASGKRPYLAAVNARLLGIWPVVVSMTITTGVAPLLFVQALYGHMFYTANILLGWTWLAVPPLLLASFYAIYIVRRPISKTAGRDDETVESAGAGRASRPGIGHMVLLALIGVAMLLIAAIFTANSTLMLVPEAWPGVHDGSVSPFAVHAMFWPRYLHNVIGSLAVTALTISILALKDRAAEASQRLAAISFGLLLTTILTIGQIMTGIWLVVTIWHDAAAAFHAVTVGNILWAIGITTGVASFFVLMAYSLNHPERPSAVWAPVALVAVTLAGMSAARERVRLGMLERLDVAVYTADTVHTQSTAAWLFVGAVVLGAGVIFLMLRWTHGAARPPPGPSPAPSDRT